MDENKNKVSQIIIDDEDDKLGQAGSVQLPNRHQISDLPDKPKPAKPRKEHFVKLKAWIKAHKKLSIGLAGLLLALLVGGGLVLAKHLQKKPAPVVAVKQEAPAPAPPAPTTLPSPLTGVQVAPELAKRPVTAMQIENSPEARPQSGLSEAGVVFEATAEGGITRFQAMWQEAKPAVIGPVRSLRPYYIDFALPFQAAVGHVGGSPQALDEVKSTGLRDIDQFANGASYHRTSDRYAPHNVYTSTADIDKLLAAKNITKSEFTPWPRKEPAPAATPNATKVTIDITSALFKVDYTWDRDSNTYLRSEGGKPHLNREDKKRLAPRVVVAIRAPHSIIDKSGHYAIGLVGSGKAYFFQDGMATEGSWKKTARSAMFNFTDNNGVEVKFDTGQTWITVVAPDKTVSYTP